MSKEREKIWQVVTGAKQHLSNKLADVWLWFMIRGVLAIGLAIVALFCPKMNMGILVKLLGAYLRIAPTEQRFAAHRIWSNTR